MTSINNISFKANIPTVKKINPAQINTVKKVVPNTFKNTANTMTQNVKAVPTSVGIVAAITTLFMSFVSLFKKLKNEPNKVQDIQPVVDEKPKVVQVPKPVIEQPVKLEFTKENAEMLNKKLIDSVVYERSIDYANIELLQKLPEDVKKKIQNSECV